MSLTDKQEMFVENLIRGMSQREAYRTAYPKCKSSDKTVDEAACRLLRDSKVLARYNELRARLIKEAEEEAIIDGKEVLREIASIARDDVGNYLRFYDDQGVIKIKIKDSDAINTKNISEVSVGKDGQFKFKLYCRDTALYKLAEILGLSKQSAADTYEKDNFMDALKEQLPEVMEKAGEIIET